MVNGPAQTPLIESAVIPECCGCCAMAGERMRVPALAAWHIENARPDRQREHLHQSSDVAAVPLLGEQRLVFPEVLRVEIGRPPLSAF